MHWVIPSLLTNAARFGSISFLSWTGYSVLLEEWKSERMLLLKTLPTVSLSKLKCLLSLITTI